MFLTGLVELEQLRRLLQNVERGGARLALLLHLQRCLQGEYIFQTNKLPSKRKCVRVIKVLFWKPRSAAVCAVSFSQVASRGDIKLEVPNSKKDCIETNKVTVAAQAQELSFVKSPSGLVEQVCTPSDVACSRFV